MWLACLLACADPAPPAPPSGTTTDTAPPPAPVVPPPGFDAAAGYELTPEGGVNRIADVPSSPDDYPFGTGSCYGSLSTTEPECVPAGCTERPNGRCALESCLNWWCTCVYACASDADCEPDEACLRPEHGLGAGIALPQCVPAGCRTGADCASGECGVGRIPDSATRDLRLACRTPDDACRSDLQCGDWYDICSPLGETWECTCSHCWCD